MVLYLRLIILLVKDDVPIDSETLLITNFVNLKIKLTLIEIACVYVLRSECSHIYISICIYTVFLKKVKGAANLISLV
jgi:hypothetical protein